MNKVMDKTNGISMVRRLLRGGDKLLTFEALYKVLPFVHSVDDVATVLVDGFLFEYDPCDHTYVTRTVNYLITVAVSGREYCVEVDGTIYQTYDPKMLVLLVHRFLDTQLQDVRLG